jgi:uncharacterized protein YjbI with pentapeptide repeats
MDFFQISEPLHATKCNLRSSTFNDVDMRDATFTNINMSNWRLNDVNLQHLEIVNANLSHASISESCLHGMEINGVLVTDLFAAYENKRP